MGSWNKEFKDKVIHCINSLGVRNEGDSSYFTMESFYDYNITGILLNKDNQVIQGSRGTGKTHILRVLEQKMEDNHTHCIFLDCRQIGSNGSCGLDMDIEDKYNHVRFFQYFLEQLYSNLSLFYSWQYIDDWDEKNKKKSTIYSKNCMPRL